VPAVVRRLEEHRLPELVVAAVACDPDVSHAAAAPGGLPGRLADARRPAHLRLAGPQLVTERAALRLVLEQGNGNLNDHARTSRYASITAARMRTDPRRRRPRRGYPHRMRRPRWQRPGQAPHGSGRRQPKRPQWPGRLPGLAACAPQRQVPQPGGNALVRSLGLHVSRRPGFGSDTTHAPGEFPYVACPPRRRGQEPGRRAEARARCRQGSEPGLGKAPAARQGPVQPDDRQSPYYPVRISRTLPVLTSCPAACQKPQSTHSIEGPVRSAGKDPRR